MGITNVVSDNNVGSTVIMAYIRIEITSMKEHQILGDKLFRFRNGKIGKLTPELPVYKSKMIGKGYTPVKNALFIHKALYFCQLSDVSRILKCIPGVRFQCDKKYLYTRQIFVNTLCVLNQGSFTGKIDRGSLVT